MTSVNVARAMSGAHFGWTAQAAREEIRPEFSYDVLSWAGGDGTLVISTDDREGLDGFWSKGFPVTGGRDYRFHALRKTQNVLVPRRSAHVTISWQDEEGNPVFREDQHRFAVKTFRDPTMVAARVARAEYPRDQDSDVSGWTEVAGTFSAPSKAAQAVVDLHLRWAPLARVEWTDVRLTETSHQERRARLAGVNLWPREDVMASTPVEACRIFDGPIREAAIKGADLVCLPECLTHKFTNLCPVEASEPIPGPSTNYLGELAKRHDLYIVAGLYERADHLIHNTAVLIGPDGSLIGKYRKVCLTPDESCYGELAPGEDFPVFETRFGKVGMLICWDMQFPEVARALSNRGADILAVPVAGMNPILASARAIENQVYIVTSAYCSATRRDWLKTGIIDYDGQMIAATEEWGTVAVADVLLGDTPRYWAHLGDLKGRIPRMRPAIWE